MPQLAALDAHPFFVAYHRTLFTMAELSQIVDEKQIKHADIKGDYDVETEPIYDEEGPVEFAEKKDLRLVSQTACL